MSKHNRSKQDKTMTELEGEELSAKSTVSFNAEPGGLNTTTVDTDTGEIPDPEPAPSPTVDVVHMPKKIVAKDIIGRAGLKCSKKWVPTKDKNGEAMNDKDGNPLGEWELSPPRQLYRVFGTATGTRTGSSVYGDWVAFTGTFEAIRIDNGDRFRSNELILQQPAEGLLLQALGEVKKRDEAGGVNFAFDIGVKTNQRWVDTGEGNSYEYTITSVFNVQKHDPLEHLRLALPPMPLQKALPKLAGG
jgi:hypothetical protein